jgi:hypothetical protein
MNVDSHDYPEERRKIVVNDDTQQKQQQQQQGDMNKTKKTKRSDDDDDDEDEEDEVTTMTKTTSAETSAETEETITVDKDSGKKKPAFVQNAEEAGPEPVVDLLGIHEMWEKEQRSLSKQERRYYERIVQGSRTCSPVEETKEMLQQSLLKMQIEIENLKNDQRRAYNKGLSMKSSYVHDADFRLSFVRAERYDPEKAAIRFCKWLDLLLYLYGDVALTRRLRYGDLQKDDAALLKEGLYQILPSRDRIGRRILTCLGPVDMKKYSSDCYVRKQKVAVTVRDDYCSRNTTVSVS